MKKINKTFVGLFLMTLTVLGAFTSCAYSSEDEQSDAGQPNGLVLNIKTSSVGTTRAALNTNSVTDANEQNVQNMVVGIFKSDGTPVSITQYTMDAATSAQGLSKNITTSYTSSTAATKQVAVDDEVLVALNVPAARLTDFTGVANKAAFKGLTLSIAEAITHTADGTAIDEDALPMFGECKVTASGNNFKADVTVIHMIAKVTLASLTVDFSETLHTNAAFTPKEVFLLNVPSSTDYGYTWAGATDAGSYTYGFTPIATANFYTGESTLTTGGSFPASADAKQQYQAAYIGSGALTITAMQTSSAAVGGYTFYTLPNNDANYNTKLVIKGKYTDDKDVDATGHDAYYAVDLYPDYSNAPTDKTVKPNYNYSVSAVIKGDGADDAYSNIPAIESLETKVTTLPFDQYQNTVTIYNGTTYEALPPAKVGDLLFSDGTWGTLDRFPAKTPVAIVFSTAVSATDYAAGYRHGYAIALKDVNSSATMAWSTETVQIGTPVNLGSQALLDSYVASATYMDGRAETDAITHTANYSQAVYPAAYAAVTTYETEVAHPTGASNWYLPSIGQQYEWIKNMGGVSTNPSFRADYKDCYWSGTASTVASAMNTFAKSHLKNTAGDVDQSALWTDILGSGGYYWASTESAYGAGYAFNLIFNPDGYLYLDGSGAKSNTNRRVRPVLAF